MMTPTLVLLICLLVATLLGTLVGASLWRLLAQRRVARNEVFLQGEVRELRRSLAELTAEPLSLNEAPMAGEYPADAEPGAQAIAEDREQAVQVHVLWQQQRIEQLEQELGLVEEQVVYLQHQLGSRRLSSGSATGFAVESTSLADTGSSTGEYSDDTLETLLDDTMDSPVIADLALPESVDKLQLDVDNKGNYKPGHG